MSTTIPISLLLILSLLPFLSASKAISLTDATFEHDTQATTGATTGDWFVNFCEKKSKECRSIEPLWDELADKLRGRLSVASVDLEKNPGLERRFAIKKVPAMYLLRKGKFYQFRGEYDLETLHRFAVEDYDQAENQGQIPVEANALEKLWKMMLEEIEENGGLLNTFLMKNEQGHVSIPAILIVYALPFFTLVGIFIICMKGESTEVAKQPQKGSASQKKQDQKNKKNQ